MVEMVIPRALDVLRGSTNPAADAALLEALPLLDKGAREAAFDMLVDRGHVPTLWGVFALCGEGDRGIKASILRRFADLHGAVRAALASPKFEARAGALEVIDAGNEWPLSYEVAHALQSKCPRTRELAATTLGRLIENLIEQPEDATRASRTLGERSQSEVFRESTKTIDRESLDRRTSTPIPEDRQWSDARDPDSEPARALTDAAIQALRTWELHYQPRALKAALWLGQRVVPALREKLLERTTRIARAIDDLLTSTKDPRLAEFVMCALAFPELRQAAVTALSACRDHSFIDAVIESAWLLRNPEVASGFRRVRQCVWLHESVDYLAQLHDDQAGRAVQLLMASGGSTERKMDQLRSLVTAGEEAVHRAVLSAVMKDSSGGASPVLNLLVSRGRGEVARLAASELERRGGGDRLGAQRVSRDNPATVRAALRSSNVLDRLRALTLIRENGLARDFAEQVYHAAHDSDPTIRSLAVAMLVDLPGATTDRLLRAATEDSDARVQANAIEALDRLNAGHRASATRSKLHSKNNRVRGNAVHSLLRLELREAGDALLTMLHDPSPAHRISALWVIERLGLSPVRMRISELGRSDPNHRVRERAKRVMGALEDLHSPSGVPGRGDRQTQDDSKVRSGQRSAPAKASTSPDEEVRT